MTKVNKTSKSAKTELQTLLDLHNGMPSPQGRIAKHSSQTARAKGLYRMFALLRSAGFEVAPSSLGGRHVDFLMQYWTMDSRALEGLQRRHSRLAMRRQPLGAACIQQHLSFLRALCAWTGKPGLVLPAQKYVSDPALVDCNARTMLEHSGPGDPSEHRRMLSRVMDADRLVGLQLRVMLAFRLNRRDAVMFCPTLAIVPPHALPSGAKEGDYIARVRHKRGIPGGWARLTAIQEDEQRAALADALAAAPTPGSHIGQPGLGLEQAKVRFSNVLRRCGVSLSRLGITSQGLRYKASADLHFELRTLAASSRQRPPGADPVVMEAVYQEIADLLRSEGCHQ